MTFNEMTVDSPRFVCPQCGAFAGHTWKDLMERVGSGWGEGPSFEYILDGETEGLNPMEISSHLMWKASHCASCQKHCLWIGTKMVFPASWAARGIEEPHVDMPSKVAELYREGVAVLPHSRRAAAALSRAALESLVKELTPELPEKVQLVGRLDALSASVEEHTAKALHTIRYFGNKVMHGADDQDDHQAVALYLDDREGPGIAELMFAAMNDLVEQRISRPKRYQDIYEILPSEFKDNVEHSQARRVALESGK